MICWCLQKRIAGQGRTCSSMLVETQPYYCNMKSQWFAVSNNHFWELIDTKESSSWRSSHYLPGSSISDRSRERATHHIRHPIYRVAMVTRSSFSDLARGLGTYLDRYLISGYYSIYQEFRFACLCKSILILRSRDQKRQR